MPNPARVLIVDDSPTVRRVLREVLEEDPDLTVVGVAADPYEAREAIKALEPDVITLDLEMPRMNGLTFLENLMRLRPTPVVMVSSLTEASAPETIEALELGAVDFVTKPRSVLELRQLSDELIPKVTLAAAQRHRLRRRMPLPRPEVAPRWQTAARRKWRVVAIGASTGGVEAIRDIVSSLPADGPPVLVAQHIPPGFSRAFAVRLDELSLAHVSEAVNGTPVEPGNVYVAPGDFHLTVAEIRGTLCLRVLKTERVNRHRPSVDVLMQSLADVVGERAVGVLLTGMGTDGAQGLLAMRRRGGATIAQDEASSVVWGMPGEAVRLGAASEVLPLGQVLDRLLEASCA